MNPKTKREKEIDEALETLKRHEVSFYVHDDRDFLEEWIFELWKHNKVKPTKQNLKLAREKAIEYLNGESFELMEDAIEWVAEQQKGGAR